jgi:ABC-type lipoprotein export system ATPase subunit
MKLKLTNFLCHEDAEFNLGDRGLTLVTATSGKGKTSILRAIHYALSGKGTGVVTWGKRTFSVEMMLGDLSISRSKSLTKSNILKVVERGVSYEGEIAQEIIQKKFGDNFMDTCYVCQLGYKSFVNMSPADKMTFLENFALSGVGIKDMKMRNKKLISETKDGLTRTLSHMEVLSRIYEEMDKPEKVEFPGKCSEKNRNVYIKNCVTKCKNSLARIKKQVVLGETLKSEHSASEKLDYSVNTLKKSIEEEEEKLTSLSNQLETVNFEGAKKLKESIKSLEILKKNREFDAIRSEILNMETELDKMIDAEKSSMTSEIEKFESLLWCESSKDEISGVISDQREVVDDSRKLTNSLRDINKIREDIEKVSQGENVESLNVHSTSPTSIIGCLTLTLENVRKESHRVLNSIETLKKEGKIQECPSCNTQLVVVSGKIQYPVGIRDENTVNRLDLEELFKQHIKEEKCLSDCIYKLKGLKSKEENELEIIESIRGMYDGDLDVEEQVTLMKEYETYKSDNNRREVSLIGLRKKLLSEDWASPIKQLQKSVEAKKKAYKSIDKLEVDEDRDIDTLQDYISTQKMNQTKVETLSDMLERSKICVSKSNVKIVDLQEEHTNKYECSKTTGELKDLIDDNKSQIEKFETEKKENDEMMELIKNWEHYTSLMDILAIKEAEILELKKEEENLSLKFTAAEKMLQFISTAESRAISENISMINSSVKNFLSVFFPDDEMCANITQYKQVKKNMGSVKNQVNIEINYKGMDCGPDNLSGGEIARLILAYTLAFSEISGSNLVLLDEPAASLDQDLAGIVYGFIKSEFQDKLVICVAHQVVEGIFDNVVRLVR